jgi:hypothetical protein
MPTERWGAKVTHVTLCDPSNLSPAGTATLNACSGNRGTESVGALRSSSRGQLSVVNQLYVCVVPLQVTYEKSPLLMDLLVKIVQYLSVAGSSPFRYKGAAIQKVVELLKVVFRASSERTDYVDRLKRCFKVSRASPSLEHCFMLACPLAVCALVVWCRLQIPVSLRNYEKRK